MLSRKELAHRWHFRLYYKFWWLDVLYPLLLSLLLFSGLTYLFYTGQKHRRVSSKLEDRLIGFSLRMAGPRDLPSGPSVMTVSLSGSDLSDLPSFRFHDYTDTTSETYARLLSKLLDLGAEVIFVNWQPLPEEGSAPYKSLFPILAKARSRGSHIYWAVQPKFIKNVPQDFRDQAIVLEADPCQVSPQLICVYNESWTQWLMQVIPTIFWKKREKGWGRSLVVSSNLPRLFPAYILYYNDVGEIADLSFKELFEKDSLSAKTVFVGNNLIQGREGMSQPAYVGRVKNITDDPMLPTRTGGTPLHKFWAQHAQLFIDDDLVGVIPHKWSFICSVLVAILTIYILLRWGALPSLGIFLAFAVFAPLVNTLMIAYARLYLPLFDSLYAGLSAFLLATFAKLSVESFYHWRLRIQQRSDTDLLDAKGNFISLVSHNLNTPVAKMQGLLSAVEPLSLAGRVKDDLIKAQKVLASIQLSIRSVLVTTALEDRNLKNEALSLVAIEKEFREQMLKPLQRLGSCVDVQLLEDDLARVPIRFDKRALLSGLSALVLLHLKDDSARNVRVRLVLQEDHGLLLSLLLYCSQEHARELEKTLHQRECPNLLTQVSVSLIHSLIGVYNGQVNVDACGLCVQLRPV